MMDQPMGRVVALQYRGAGQVLTGSVFRVHIRTHLDTYDYTELPNQHWRKQNPTLQFMALHGYRPSDIEGTMMNIEDDMLVLPIAPDGHGGWGLGSEALEGGQDALEAAEWFEGGNIEDGAIPDAAPPGGGGPDPGTGNKAGVDIEVAGEDDDSGINVRIE